MGDARHKAYVLGWKAAGAALAEIRKRELRRTETPVALRQLAAAFDDGTRRYPPRSSSGLIEQQRLFLVLAKRLGLV